jgi:hypothetical protein
VVNPSPTAAPGSPSPMVGGHFVDTKPYIAHDPRIGYLYVPNSKMTLPVPGGGTYTIAINAAGIRSNREYTPKKPPGVHFRIIVLGDSFTAGQYVSNEHRFTEHLERRLGGAGTEVINFGLEGTGTDQQVLIYEHVARHYEHDLVIILPFLQNIRRNMVDARESFDPNTLEKIWLPKPRFHLKPGGVEGGGGLELTGVPVPDRRLTAAEVGHHAGADGHDVATDTDTSLVNKLKFAVRNAPGVRRLKQAISRVRPHEPFPEYADPNSEAWRLQAAIVRRLHALASPRPVVVAPIFYASYLMYNKARNYLDRFNELAAEETLSNPPLHVIDLHPHFARQGDEAVRCFLEPHDSHFSAHGNLVLAEALQSELTQRGLLKR